MSTVADPFGGVKEPFWRTEDEVMGSVSSLRSSLLLQAALTALYGLPRSDGGAWTILTMVVAAGAVFVGAALVPTPQMRVGALAFESVAVAFGVIGLLSGHLVPATLIAIGVLVLLVGAGAVREFAGPPAATLSGYRAPVASPFAYPAAPEPVAAPALVAPPVPAPVPVAHALSGAAAVFAAGQSAPGGVLPPQAAPVPVTDVAVPAVPVVPTRAAPAMTILPSRRKS
jgi:hypothetical protein